MTTSKEAMKKSFLASIAAAKASSKPYPHWILGDCLPASAVEEVLSLPFPAPALDGVSGKRELHNNTRKYFDQENMGRFPICRAFNETFQDGTVTSSIEKAFGARLKGSYLRVEFAQDTDGFWLEPHTDLGVKLFTMLLYLSKDKSHADLGTDIYDAEKKHLGRSPFISNGAMIFIPSNVTYHGFEKRRIEGVRKSVIINYVTNEWRAREQLAYPSMPIAA
ncbi:MAG: 2OG-Fe(II) oxygenase [Hyphomicrobiaceae bacterium]|nr:MAG: 2OG-Fe(II) oxygenase [Hyphomicrobiaceae bacterium]